MMTKRCGRGGREFFVLMAVGIWGAAGCLGTGMAGPGKVPRTVDSMPPFAVAAKSHVGSLSTHSFAREGADDSASPSPDGSWLVYASTRNSKERQLYRQASTGSVVTQLTYGPGSHIQPAASPDGREIAYAGNDSDSWDIWIMPNGGGASENLTSTRDLDEVHPTWHPSGKALAFGVDRDPGAGREWWVCAKSRGASGVSWIAPGLNPAWSPTGDRIAFQRARRRGRREFSIWTAEVALDANGLVSGGAQSQIVSDPAWSAIEPAFSPDGERIAFVAVEPPEGREGAKGGQEEPVPGGDIWCVRLGGGDLVRLTDTPEPDWNPAWAGVAGKPGRNGRVFFTSRRDGRTNIWSLMPVFHTPGPAVPPSGAGGR